MDWNHIAEEYRAIADEVFSNLTDKIDALANDMAERIRNGNKILLCGNGGSAADAQHMACELVNRLFLDREPYAAIALSTDTSTLTSIANDFGFEHVFEKQVQALGKEGDLLLAISTSGNADNVCLAAEAARERGIRIVALTGGNGGKLAGLVDESVIVISSTCTPRIQEGHSLIIHALCERIEEILQ